MKRGIEKQLIKNCIYCAKEIGRNSVGANILLYVLSLDSTVKAHLLMGGADMKILTYLLNPYHIRSEKSEKVKISDEVSKLLLMLKKTDTNFSFFLKCMKEKYIREIFEMTGYMEKGEGINILSKYTKKVDYGVAKSDQNEKYKKIDSLLGKKNVMIMGAVGSGRYGFIKNYAKYNESNFIIYYFDLFKYLKLEEDRLFGIVEGVFDDIGENYVYIPNFLKTVAWIRSFRLDSLYTLLEELSKKGKIITNVNKDSFDSKEFMLSKEFNFYSINTPDINMDDLSEILKSKSFVYEKFYDIEIPSQSIKEIMREANFKDKSIAQPGKSLKRLMRLALVKYGRDDSLLQNPRESRINMSGMDIVGILKKSIIGQDKPLDDISYEVGNIDFMNGGVVKTFFFQGEIGCGKLKTGRELSKILFSEDCFRYLDMSVYDQYPYKLEIYKDIDSMVKTMSGGIIYLDNIEYLNMEEFDILQYIKLKLNQMNSEEIIAPVIVIASSREEINQIASYKYIVEHFDKIVRFNKLTMRDLEKVAYIQLDKIKGIIKDKDKEFNAFVISANSNPDLNALGVKKFINAIYF